LTTTEIIFQHTVAVSEYENPIIMKLKIGAKKKKLAKPKTPRRLESRVILALLPNLSTKCPKSGTKKQEIAKGMLMYIPAFFSAS